MKKLVLAIMLGLIGSCFADTVWLTKDQIVTYFGEKINGVKITAVAFCETKKEAEKACGSLILQSDKVGTEMPDEPTEIEFWAVVFLEYAVDTPKFVAYHYIPHGPCEYYIVFR